MSGPLRVAGIAAVLACALAPATARAQLPTLPALPTPAPAAPAPPAVAPQPYGLNDFGGFRDVLPAGNDGLDNSAEGAAGLLGVGDGPQHFDDQQPLYEGLLYASPGITADRIPAFFADNTFGVRENEVEREYRPGGRSDVVVRRDSSFGRPHVTGSTREGTMFGAGYVAAEDRLFLMDLLRHIGRASVASFLGGSATYREFDHDQWASAPYTDAQFQLQFDRLDDRFGAEGAGVQADTAAYVAGVNQYVTEAKADPSKLPVEYAAIGKPGGPDPFAVSDVIASGAVIGAQLGGGGGSELQWAQLLQSFKQRFGRRHGTALWQALYAPNDPESPNTVRGRTLRWQPVPKHPRKGSVALPDAGSVKPVSITATPSARSARGRLSAQGQGIADALGSLFSQSSHSNAVLISARKSAAGHPLAVFGPQAGYFSSQIFVGQDLHGPGIDASGVGVPGASQYVEIGHGRDYAWSATSAHNDVVDVFAVPLCDDDHYRFRGRCEAIQRMTKTNAWTPNLLDSTPAGSETLQAEVTKLGIVQARGTVKGKPVLFTKLRSTYLHEFDSAVGFRRLDDPGFVTDARSFQRAAAKIGYAFNWLYADDRDIAYLNGGANNPLRRSRINPLLPVSSRFEWRGFDPADNSARYASIRQMPQTINQDWIVNWNNRQVRGYTFTDPGRTSVYRSQLLAKGVRAHLHDEGKLQLTDAIDIAQDAATQDLRGEQVLPVVLRVLGRPKDPQLAQAATLLRDWARRGAHRIDRDADGVYEDDAAIRLMDAWWPKLVEAEFRPRMGKAVYDGLVGRLRLDNAPHNDGAHLGSAYESGWYGYVSKDLRTLLAPKAVRGRYPVVFCGGGKRAKCRAALRATLATALAEPVTTTYSGDAKCDGLAADRLAPCYDQIRFSAVNAVPLKPMPWQNRPTYQQVVEVQGHRPR